MSYLSEIVRLLVLPPRGLFALLVLALALWHWRPAMARKLAFAAMALLVLLSVPAVARIFVYPLEHSTPVLAAPARAGAGAIVVLAAGRLGAAPEYDNEDVPDDIALLRLRYAARLHHQTQLPVLVSGGGVGEPLAVGMQRALERDFKVPVRWVESRSANTAENAEFSADVLRHAGITRILLVTDSMSMPRARLAFARTGIEVVPAPTVYFSTGPLRPAEFIPGLDGLFQSNYALYEWAGLVKYWIQYADHGE